MAKCMHENKTIIRRDDDIAMGIRCVDCGHWLSFGPADDTPEAQVELRAAELAASPTAEHLDESHCAHWWENEGSCCRCGYDGGVFGPLESRGVGLCEIGYLARAIVQHDEEQAAQDLKEVRDRARTIAQWGRKLRGGAR